MKIVFRPKGHITILCPFGDLEGNTMKRIIYVICTIFLLAVLLCGCAKEEPQEEASVNEENEEFICVKETQFNYYGDQVYTSVSRYAYDETGNVVFSLIFDEVDGVDIPSLYGTNFAYDENGEIISESYYNAFHETDNYCSEYENTNFYDENGVLIQSQRILPDSDLCPTDAHFEYDADGRIKKETVYVLGTDELYSYSNPEDFEYDSYGNVVKQKITYVIEDSEICSYCDYSVIEYEYIPLSEYLESQTVGIEGTWNNAYDRDLTWEIGSSEIQSNITQYDMYHTKYEIVDAHNLRFTDDSDSANIPYMRYFEDGTEYLFIQNLLPLYDGFILERTDTSKNKNWLEESEVNEGSAIVIASQLIERYWRYRNFQHCCNIESAGDGGQFTEDPRFGKLTAEEQSAFIELDRMLMTSVDKVFCCKTVEEVNQHTKQYLDSSLISSEMTEEGTYMIDGELYIQRGIGVGIDSYDNNPGKIKIESLSNDEIVAVTSHYNSGGEKMEDSVFHIGRVGGKFMLMQVEESS